MRGGSRASSRWATPARRDGTRHRDSRPFCSTSRCRTSTRCVPKCASKKKLHQKLGETIVYVTHDQVEAMTLADRVVVLQAGNLIIATAPDGIYNRPAAKFVAGFHGVAADELGHADRQSSVAVCTCR